MGVMEGLVGAAVQLMVGQEWELGQRQLDVGSCWTLPIQLQLVSCFFEAKRRRGQEGRTDWVVGQRVTFGVVWCSRVYASICVYMQSENCVIGTWLQ
jgi:hypothetical protein